MSDPFQPPLPSEGGTAEQPPLPPEPRTIQSSDAAANLNGGDQVPSAPGEPEAPPLPTDEVPLPDFLQGSSQEPVPADAELDAGRWIGTTSASDAGPSEPPALSAEEEEKLLKVFSDTYLLSPGCCSSRKPLTSPLSSVIHC